VGIGSNRRGNPEGSSLGRYLKDIARYPLLSREEEGRLAVRIREGCEASLAQLVCSNLRFVVSVAKRHQSRGVALGDLINEGNLALIHAAHRFDETRGVRFVSYAVWGIRHAMVRALVEQGRVVRLPLRRSSALHRIGKRSAALGQVLGREPTVDEIADAVAVPREEVERALGIVQSQLSLEAPLAPGSSARLVDRLPDPRSLDPDDEAGRRALAASVEEALGRLAKREVLVLRLHYGLEDGRDPMTLEEIGALLGITGSRVRQIRERALLRLRQATPAPSGCAR
jgi:RNA polymerase primary sigma factor